MKIEKECCPCGKNEFENVGRKSCTDPLKTCGEKCNKQLDCGKHFCKKKCHDSPCNKCKTKLLIRCRCNKKLKYFSCSKINQSSFVHFKKI